MSTPPPGLPNTLGDIILKVRRICKMPNQNQITDNQIIQYVDTYYLYDFPEELRMKNLYTNYSFITVPYQETYPLPTDTYVVVETPLYINGYQSFFTQSQDNFYMLYPRLGIVDTTNVGDSGDTYDLFIQTTPVLQNQVVVGATDNSGVTHNAIDVPQAVAQPNLQLNPSLGYFSFDGGTTVDLNSTINYVTGAIHIIFPTTIGTGNQITINSVPYFPSRPTACLFYADTFSLRPIPDNSYLVEIATYITPSNMEAQTATPQIKQWWQLLAWGAALKILEDRGDFDQVQKMRPFYEEQKNLVLRRTLVQQSSERTATIYTEQTGYGNNNWFGQF